VTPDQIVDFFQKGEFSISTDDVVIECRDGKNTGFGLAFLANEEDAATAIESLHKEYIGSRFIQLSAAP
jgi:RNA recognition motif-containing protein